MVDAGHEPDVFFSGPEHAGYFGSGLSARGHTVGHGNRSYRRFGFRRDGDGNHYGRSYRSTECELLGQRHYGRFRELFSACSDGAELHRRCGTALGSVLGKPLLGDLPGLRASLETSLGVSLDALWNAWVVPAAASLFLQELQTTLRVDHRSE